MLEKFSVYYAAEEDLKFVAIATRELLPASMFNSTIPADSKTLFTETMSAIDKTIATHGVTDLYLFLKMNLLKFKSLMLCAYVHNAADISDADKQRLSTKRIAYAIQGIENANTLFTKYQEGEIFSYFLVETLVELLILKTDKERDGLMFANQHGIHKEPHLAMNYDTYTFFPKLFATYYADINALKLANTSQIQDTLLLLTTKLRLDSFRYLNYLTVSMKKKPPIQININSFFKQYKAETTTEASNDNSNQNVSSENNINKTFN